MPHVNRIIMIHVLTWLFACVASGIITAILAGKKGQNQMKWFFLGAVAPFVSIIAITKTNELPSGKDFEISDDGYKLMRRWFAVLTSFVAFIVYAQTAQPTVPFWDCGEFIACSYSLSVPHPPGAPLFLLLGRIVSLLPLDWLAPLWGLDELSVAHKLNLMSGFFNSIGIGLLFLIITKAVGKYFIKLNSASEYSITMMAGFVGALLAAFSSTFWENSVEAEVYGPAMMITNLVIYLSMLWYEKREKPSSDRYLILIPFLLYLGISIHLTTMIMLPPIFLFVLFCSPEKRKDPFFWLTWIVLFSVATSFELFLWSMAFGLIFTLIGSIATHMSSAGKSRGTMQRTSRRMGLAFITLLLAALAFSLSLYTIIRSHHDPLIDENDPETIEEFADYMDRKQYGQETMWELMFKRKGLWKNQLGVHPRMGFWGFFRVQWTDVKTGANGLIPFALALFALIYFPAKHKQFWLLLFLALLISTLGLAIYINFSDGTQGVKLEVRDRDYFYTPGYMFFAAWIGMGVAAILAVFDRLRKQAKLPSAITLGLAFLMTFIPVVPLKTNWFAHDRSRNYIPHDYAYNILNSCDKNSILFTNGDNDTFPLWFLQVVLGERADVCIANLSLLNTSWYIKQLKTRTHFKYTGTISSGKAVDGKMWADNDVELKTKLGARGISLVSSDIIERRNQFGHDFVNIQFSDEKIDMLRPYRTSSGEIVRVQDIMVKHLIENTKITMSLQPLKEPDPMGREVDTVYNFEPPIYFAVTVSPDNKLNYGPYLRMEGLAYRLTGKPGERQVEPNIMKDYLFNRYLFRGLTDPTIYKDENSEKLLQNYTTAFMTLALEYKNMNQIEKAKEVMERALNTLPYDWRVAMFSADIYSTAEDWDRFDKVFDEVMVRDSTNIRLIRVFADIAFQRARPEKLENIMDRALRANPDDRALFMARVGYMYQLGKVQEMNEVIERWVAKNPQDAELRRYLDQVRQEPQLQVVPDREKEISESSIPTPSPAIQGDLSPR